MGKSKKFLFLFLVLLMAMLAGCGSEPELTEKAKKDGITINQMTWGVYDVGSSGYSEMSAIANAMTENYNMNIRLLPSTTGIGRISIIRNKISPIGSYLY